MATQVVVRKHSWLTWFLVLLLLVSLAANYYLWNTWVTYFSGQTPPVERFHSGERNASDKIALLRMRGTIMPPFTERLIAQIRQAERDEAVKAIILEVDSPGGLIADSHQIYHELQELRKSKPIYVRMKRLAASGGYYISMGAGPDARIFVEPTTWTGSIGVIIPRYNMADLAEKYGVSADPIKTGLLKDSLNPFRKMEPEERVVWDAIIDDAYQQFITVIETNRPSLTRDQVESLATGQIYTARQALEKGLADETGFLEDVVAALKTKAGLTEARVITYENAPNVFDLVSAYTSAKSNSPVDAILDASVPRAMYYCSWAPMVGAKFDR